MSSKKDTISVENEKKINQKKLLLINESEIISSKNDENNILIKKFKHPKTQELRPYLLISDKNLFELIKYEPEYNSVFIDNYIQSSSQMYFATEFNVNYFMIAIAYDRQNDYLDLNELYITDEIENKPVYLKKLINSDKIDERLFDVKHDFNFKFNLNKCLNWLKIKVLTLNEFLNSSNKSNKILSAATVTVSKTNAENSKNDLLINSFELIAQYVNASLCQLLIKELDLNDLIENVKPTECKRVKSSVN